MSTVYIIIFYILLHFFLIELKNYWWKNIITIIIISIFLETFIIWFSNIMKLLSLYVLNLGIIFLISSIEDEITNRKKIFASSIFSKWVWFFSLIISLSYALMFVSMYKEFNLTCDILYSNLTSFVDTVSKPLELSIEQVNYLKGWISDFYNTRMRDVLGLWENFDPDALSWIDLQNLDELDLQDINSLSWLNLSWLDLSISWWILSQDVGTWWEDSSWWIFGWIDSFRKWLITQVFSDKQFVDKWVCSFMMESIKERYQKPSFKFSVIILLFFVLIPFIRILFFIASLFGMILFFILRLLRVYKYQIILDEVEDII